MKKLAIIGASYLQLPLIEKAKKMGLETHVFAWAAGDVGESIADFFYPISIVEKEEILKCCIHIGIDGICSIASDLAMITVNYVAANMGLTANSLECTEISTNKHKMRKAFEQGSDPSPKSILVESAADLKGKVLHYPVIVKPTDRSGSRGITKLENPDGLENAISSAKKQSFARAALVEEFAEGNEYSVECISWNGEHTFLAMTRKYTTGAPGFVETAHFQPAPVTDSLLEQVKHVVFHALDSLKVEYGASHTELKISYDGRINLIEIGARMGGDLIGSHLVELSSGVDFVKAVIQIALGEKPVIQKTASRASAVRYVFNKQDLLPLERMKQEAPDLLIQSSITAIGEETVSDSSMRFGYYLMAADTVEQLLPYLPQE